MNIEGVKVARRLIFSAPVTREGWGADMVRHIQIAKALGATLFEIDIPGTVAVPRPKEIVVSMWNVFSGAATVEGDEWKDAATAKDKKMDALVVSVWAMTVEDDQ